jgi:hypothetical protein
MPIGTESDTVAAAQVRSLNHRDAKSAEVKLALLLNFNVALLKDGVERFVMGLEEEREGTTETRRARSGWEFRSDSVVQEWVA